MMKSDQASLCDCDFV